MKTIRFKKKLSLNKNTVASLDQDSMAAVYGGDETDNGCTSLTGTTAGGTGGTRDCYTNQPCDTFLNTCIRCIFL